MTEIKNFFFKKKNLIYGLGKTGISSYYFLKKKNYLYLYDDNFNFIKNKQIKKSIIKLSKIFKKKFDFILISPGIDVNNCNLRNFLKKNMSKIITDLDVFYMNFSNNKNIAITGTNGKSTTSKLLFDILKTQHMDARLVGNIGNPILSEKKITNKTFFVIEASSYQLEYSQFFKTNYALILNISPDHLERHKTFSNYVKSKLKLVRNQTSKDYSFFNRKDSFIKREISKIKINSKIVNVDIKYYRKKIRKIKNNYFITFGNQQNLSFIFAIAEKLKLKNNKLLKSINNFKGLSFRQEIINKSKKFTLINDSKATSFSSSVNILKSLTNVFWLVGGIPKKGDRFSLTKKQCKSIKAYIFGKNKKHFIKNLEKKVKFQTFKNLEKAIKKIIIDIKKEINNEHKIILFSPSAASFDSFKNFEDRGKKFNFFINKLKLKKLIST